VLAATALFGSFTDAWSSQVQQLLNTNQITEAPSQFVQNMFNTQIVTPSTLVGLLLGAAVVFLFSGLAINAVTRAAGAIVFEVRRQFREHPGIMDYTEKPEYARVVDICTRDSLRELATPGLLAALTPVVVGFGLGVGALAGFLAGAIGTGCLMAVFLANSGGSWDNAKKIVEDGHYGGKGSDAHAATVIGDTVGDPFKDTAGPAINPLLKVMNLVSVLIAPAIVIMTLGNAANPLVRYGIAAVALIIIVAAVAVSKSRDLAVGGDEDVDEAEPLDDDELAATPEEEALVTGAEDEAALARGQAQANEEQSRV
jgi:K(+)-stimulated pyrophosphate-energized sodium pump